MEVTGTAYASFGLPGLIPFMQEDRQPRRSSGEFRNVRIAPCLLAHSSRSPLRLADGRADVSHYRLFVGCDQPLWHPRIAIGPRIWLEPRGYRRRDGADAVAVRGHSTFRRGYHAALRAVPDSGGGCWHDAAGPGADHADDVAMAIRMWV